MAGNVLTRNPYYVDTAATLWTETNTGVRLIQWIDDAGDIADDDDLDITINGVTIAAKIQIDADDLSLGQGVVAWNIGPFNPGFCISDFIVNTIDHGVLLIWV